MHTTLLHNMILHLCQQHIQMRVADNRTEQQNNRQTYQRHQSTTQIATATQLLIEADQFKMQQRFNSQERTSDLSNVEY